MFDKNGNLMVSQLITGTQIVALLEALAGVDRLDADAVEIADAEDIITATDVEVALQEIKFELDDFPDELKNLVTAEIQQLENIGATTISAAQWGFLGGSSGIDHFVDRGDPSDYDFILTDLTTNGAWQDLDLSSIVPVGTKAVILRIIIQDDAVSSEIIFRKNGNSNARNFSGIRIQVANISRGGDLFVSIDSNRIIEYKATNTTWTGIFIVVAGWWIA